jgi:hypothetical protein
LAEVEAHGTPNRFSDLKGNLQERDVWREVVTPGRLELEPLSGRERSERPEAKSWASAKRESKDLGQ